MSDRQYWRGLAAITAVTLSLALAPATAFAFPESTEASGESTPRVTGTWCGVNRIEFPKGKEDKPGPSPAPSPSPGAASIRPFTVGYIFTIEHLTTAEAQKGRDAEKAQKQA